ncbi:MAG: hypothetical protein ACOCTN_05440 [Candidatus Natronoplasma sp.]
MTGKEKGILVPVLVGLFHFLIFVVIASMALYYVSGIHPDLEKVFQMAFPYVVVFGTLITFSAVATSYFDKGEFLRLGSGVGKAFCFLAYGIGIYNSLDLSIHIENFVADVTFPGLLALKVTLIIFYGGYFVLEYFLYSKEREEEETLYL